MLKLLFQFSKVSAKLAQVKIDGEKGSFIDRFYRTLYEVILKVSQTKAQKLDEFFGLVFKAMRADPSVPRVLAFVRRLLQMTFCNEAAFTCACLLVINEVFRSRQDVRYTVFQQASKPVEKAAAMNDSSDEEVFKDADRLEEEQKQA